MENTDRSTKFLQFNNTLIYFIDVEGKKYIAYKPICDALNIDANRSYKNLKKDRIIGPALAKLPMQVENNGIIQVRKLTCIPEKYIYGWIFSLKSDNTDIDDFKKECYDVLFEHFNGVIAKRKDLLIDAFDNQNKIKEIKKKLERDPLYIELLELEQKTKTVSNEMKKLDKCIIGQQEIKF